MTNDSESKNNIMISVVNQTKLKIKHTSLAAEMKLIRAEELRLRSRAKKLSKRQKPNWQTDSAREQIHIHRIVDIRPECRATHLALAYMQCKPYSVVERNLPDLLDGHERTRWVDGITKALWRAARLVQKYGSNFGAGLDFRWLKTSPGESYSENLKRSKADQLKRIYDDMVQWRDAHQQLLALGLQKMAA